MPAIALVAAGARLGLSLGKVFGEHGFDVALIGRAPNKRIDARTVRERAERFGVLPRMPMMPAPDQTSNAPAIWAGTRIRASMLRDLVRPGLVALVVAVGIAAVYAVASHGIR